MFGLVFINIFVVFAGFLLMFFWRLQVAATILKA